MDIYSDKIFVIEKNNSNKIKIKGSSFLGYSFKVSSVNEAQSELDNLKKIHYDATHHCYAYKLNAGDERYSDDGEPGGSAGIRIKNSIDHFSLTNILVVVVRYFGGTRLGIGPLGKAYAETATNLLENSKLNELTKFDNYSITFHYDHISIVHHILSKYNCQKIESDYSGKPYIQYFVDPKNAHQLIEELTEKTAGSANVSNLSNSIYLQLK